MGTLSVTNLRGGRGIFDDLKRFVCRFQALKGPLGGPEGPLRFSMDKLVCHEKLR